MGYPTIADERVNNEGDFWSGLRDGTARPKFNDLRLARVRSSCTYVMCVVSTHMPGSHFKGILTPS